MSARTRLLIGLGLLTVATGCLDFGDDDDGGVGCGTPPNGLAGRGNFVYECPDHPADPFCDGKGSPSTTETPPLPRTLARGAHFRLRFVSPLSPLGSKSPVSTSAKAVGTKDGEFIALRTGGIGFFIADGAEAEDAIRFEVVEAQRFEIEGADRFGFDSGKLMPGESRAFRVVALGGSEPLRRLAGSLHVTWSATPTALVAIESNSDGTCSVTARAPGQVRLRATDDRIDAELAIEIDGTPIRDAGSDAARDGSADAADGGDR